VIVKRKKIKFISILKNSPEPDINEEINLIILPSKFDPFVKINRAEIKLIVNPKDVVIRSIVGKNEKKPGFLLCNTTIKIVIASIRYKEIRISEIKVEMGIISNARKNVINIVI